MKGRWVQAFALAVLGASTIAGAQTKVGDKVAPFALDYFVGSWTFDWSVPETPMGPGGDLVGTVTFRRAATSSALAPLAGFPDWPASVASAIPAGAQMLEGRIEGTGPSGPLKTRVLMTYDPATGAAARYEAEHGGTTFVKKGTVTGDLGGIYTFTWQAEPIQRDGQTVRLKGRTVGFSPRNFREFIQYSLDGTSFTTFGQPWYQKANDR